MRLLDRHIGSTVFAGIVGMLALLVAIDSLFNFIEELKFIRNDYQFWQAAEYIGLTLPKRIYDFTPFAAMIGCLVGLGSLASNSELVVMRSSGISLQRIVWSVAKPVFVLIIFAATIGEFVLPYTEQLSESRRSMAAFGTDKKASNQRGVWHREGNDYYHFNIVEPNGVLHGISQFRFDDQRRMLESSYAQRGIYQGDHWLLENVTTSTYEEKQAISQSYATHRWDSGLNTDILNILVLEPENLSISGLVTYVGYLQDQGLEAGEYALSMWQKILQPLSILALMMIGISFVMGPLRSVSMGLRVFTGVLFGFVFKIVQDLMGPSSMVFGFSPIIATVVPIALCLLLGFILLRRAS